jgi:hypothetical protein
MSDADATPIALPDINANDLTAIDLRTQEGRNKLAKCVGKDIDTWCEAALAPAKPFRHHLGASIIGHSCDRYLWFVFRWMVQQQMDGRQLRLVRRGTREEIELFMYLRGIGWEFIDEVQSVYDFTLDHKQFEVSMLSGHFGGSLDARAIAPARYGPQIAGKRFLFEFKTCKEQRWNPLSVHGVLKEKPEHYAQMCVYFYKGIVDGTIYFSVNKNNDQIYIEVLELDSIYGQNLLERAKRIINSFEPPKRISENSSWYECKYCPALGICHQQKPIERNCRSCINARPIIEGDHAEGSGPWHCQLYNALIPKEFLIQGCKRWQPLY